MKNVVLILILVTCFHSFYGQTLVRYGSHTISREEFLSAFQKNNTRTQVTEKAYRDYLNLFIRYRLKVQAAYDMGLDTLAGQITELQNFKSQVVDQYLNDESSLNQMAKEAFVRSQKDLQISYIFVSAPRNMSPPDTAKAWQKIQEAYRALQGNKNFGETALQYSGDPFVTSNKGDIGLITVFDLPYAMETVAYGTPLGKFSPVFRTNGGYVIVKKTAEAKALGRIRVAQILLAFPYQATETAKVDTKRRADSIYRALQSGSDFGELARKFSGDNLSYQLGGILPEFGIGKYEHGFESTAYSLKKDGDISTPYESAFGYHIIKRIKRIPVPPVADQKTLDELKEKIKTDPRVAVSKKRMTETVIRETKMKEYIPRSVLYKYTDSALLNKKPAPDAAIADDFVLFEFPKKKYFVSDWIAYRRSLKSSPNLTNGKSDADILDAYRQIVAFEYYKQHLELYNAAYAAQVSEFRDGNLLFEVMQRKIWNRATADTTGLKKYFESHKGNYAWKPGVEGIVFTASNQVVAHQIRIELEKNIKNWRKIIDSVGGQVQADSGRFEWKQLPGKGQSGTGSRFTAYGVRPSPDNSDKSIQFVYIIREYPGSAPRTFEEARGLVINDYQDRLENEWIEELKRNYPVVINETVFKTLPIKSKLNGK